jgi:hypothetical protein
MGEMRSACKIFVRKPERRDYFETSVLRGRYY